MKIITFTLFVLCLTACNSSVNKPVDSGTPDTTVLVDASVDAGNDLGIQECDAGF